MDRITLNSDQIKEIRTLVNKENRICKFWDVLDETTDHIASLVEDKMNEEKWSYEKSLIYAIDNFDFASHFSEQRKVIRMISQQHILQSVKRQFRTDKLLRIGFFLFLVFCILQLIDLKTASKIIDIAIIIGALVPLLYSLIIRRTRLYNFSLFMTKSSFLNISGYLIPAVRRNLFDAFSIESPLFNLLFYGVFFLLYLAIYDSLIQEYHKVKKLAIL